MNYTETETLPIQPRSACVTTLRFLTIGWFVFCFAIMLALVLSDHWLVFAAALTPLPSLLVPLSLMWFVVLIGLQPRSIPWALAALVTGLVLCPYGTGYWRGKNHANAVMDDGETNEARETPNEELAILAANVGQRDVGQLIKFIESTQPDIVATQDGRPKSNSEWLNTHDHSEVERFSLWSRWPILESEPIEFDGNYVAARFEVAWPVTPIVVYVMHLPTPRFMLEGIRGRGILRKANRLQAAEFQQEKRRILTLLTQRVAREAGPVLLVGDANQPASGPAYRQLTRDLLDGHRAAGRGFGFTLPGSVNTTLLQRLCPWARVDYILAGDKLEFLEHRTEPHHDGQHLANFARLRLSPH